MTVKNDVEDAAEKEWWNKFEIAVNNKSVAIPGNTFDTKWFADAIILARDMGYDEGYDEGVLDERKSSD